ncbi:hypothetical protein LCGC14_0563750 [marine sediment metagenome]|uniref:Uncharacterized protein n=1 Tax=marine sediment metagenome TaxID=412755 RepID=A0A0F9RRK1_9ZZZZ
MSDSRPKELLRVEQLINEVKFEEALKIIENFEIKEPLTSEDQLSMLLLKGRIYGYNNQFEDAVTIGEQAYLMSQKLELVSESIEALFLKSRIMFVGRIDKALGFILEAEKKINSLADKSSSDILRQQVMFLALKSWGYWVKGEIELALKTAKQTLSQQENIDNKIDIANNYLLMGEIYSYLRELDTALDYATKSLDIAEELEFQPVIGTSSMLISRLYVSKSNYNQALDFCKKSLLIKEISSWDKVRNLNLLGEIYYFKSEFDRSLQYYNQAIALAEEENIYEQLALNLYHVGYIYRLQGEYDRAIETSESGLTLAEKIGYQYVAGGSLESLILICLDKGSIEQAKQYLTRLEKLSEQAQQKVITDWYSLSKAMILKMDGRTRNRAEAEVMLRKIIDDTALHSEYRQFALINLCDLYLEDLYLSKNLEILEDINPLLTETSMIAEQHHSYLWVAMTKFLQAKLALIQMKMDEAKHLLTEAQNIAESHSLDLLAIKISSEHDALLTQVDDWENLRKKGAPIGERLGLVSLEETIDVMLRKRGIQPPELTDEVPVLLLIIAEGGIPAFSYPFSEEWSIDDGFISNFLTAFNTFSEEVFSKGLDRAKFGEYTLVMDSFGSFSVCYLFKGQSYLAKQNLLQFAHRVQNTTSIWQNVNNFHKTHQPIVLSENPPLESLITEIFIKESPEISTLL